MSKDYSERRTYRKSPGRQYGYDYDPLRNRSEQNQNGRPDASGQGERGATHGETASKSGALMAQRPDLRRTRQLLRQNIIATKARIAEESGEQEDLPDTEEPFQHTPEYEEAEETAYYNRRNPTRSGRIIPRPTPSQELIETQEEGEEWDESGVGDADLDLGYDEEPDPFDRRPGYTEVEPVKRSPLPPPVRPRQGIPTRRDMRPIEPEDDYYDDEEYDYDEEEFDRPPVRRKSKKKVSRRALLVGAGVVAIGGTSIAAYELAPKIPQVVGTAAHNVEQQVQDAFQKGITQGAENVRKEFVTALDNLEGFSLDGAIAAAKLTRVAYDVFVAPVIQFGSTLAGDFLGGMLKAFKAARNVLIAVNMDNSSLIAIQKVLESWTSQVSTMPKQLNAIADTDLDGAQSYLRALQRKIDDEKAKLNNPQPQATPGAKPTAQPTKKPK